MAGYQGTAVRGPPPHLLPSRLGSPSPEETGLASFKETEWNRKTASELERSKTSLWSLTEFVPHNTQSKALAGVGRS